MWKSAHQSQSVVTLTASSTILWSCLRWVANSLTPTTSSLATTLIEVSTQLRSLRYSLLWRWDTKIACFCSEAITRVAQSHKSMAFMMSVSKSMEVPVFGSSWRTYLISYRSQLWLKAKSCACTEACHHRWSASMSSTNLTDSRRCLMKVVFVICCGRIPTSPDPSTEMGSQYRLGEPAFYSVKIWQRNSRIGMVWTF